MGISLSARRVLALTAPAALLALSGPAAALTANEAWSDLQTYLQSFGYSVDAQVSEESGSVVVTDLVASQNIDEGSFAMEMPGPVMTFTEQGDGTVAMVIPESQDINVTAVPDEGDTMNIALNLATSAFSTVISGEPGDVTWTYDGDSMRVSLLSVEGAPDDAGAEDMTFSATLEDIEGTSRMQGGDLRQMMQELTAARLTYELQGTDDETEEEVAFAGTATGFRMTSDTALPADVDPEDMQAMIEAGFAVSATIASDASAGTFSVNGPEGNGSGETTSGPGRLSFQLDGTTLLYEVASEDIAVAFTAPDFPFPINFAGSEMSTKFRIPVAVSEEMQPVEMSLVLADLTVSDMLWSIFDPEAVLPRDPATLAIHLAGEVKPKGSFFNPEDMSEMAESDEVPAELGEMRLEVLTLKAAGAELNGVGAFTFDNSDLETFDGMPRPEGEIRLSLTGANALIDKLVSLGFVGAQEAMGARMMMSMFAVPGEGEDSLTSTIEVNEDGQVLANGQRIR
ncbi:DUF2125 domain-containing protein [Litorisediminicola beolgyonensis]|uniref:DUF2125 domain-containing protein n=1 Tax=Litorisediminicola beolgyonensis TaxID=1173614 RepID=A0ABW3ZCT4_9RHOB